MEEPNNMNTLGVVSKFGIDVTKEIAGEDFKLPSAPLIKMDEAVRKKINSV